MGSAHARKKLSFLTSCLMACTKLDFSSREFYEVYQLWCQDNAVNAFTAKTFWTHLKQNAAAYNLEYTNNVHIGGGKRVRGFWGIQLLQRPGF